MATSFVTATTSNAANSTITTNALRQFLRIQNQDASNSIFVNFGTAAVASQCLRIGAGQTMDFYAKDMPMIQQQLNVLSSATTAVYIAVDNI